MNSHAIEPSIEPFGPDAVLVTGLDAATARHLATHLRAVLADRVASVVPGAETVVVTGRPGLGADALASLVTTHAADSPATPGQRRHHQIPVRYDGEDLAWVATRLAIPQAEVITRHTAVEYTVAFLGFAPGFPYLTGLDPLLTVPRLDSPRSRIPAGAVGLATGHTCIYPTASPGGWRLIGTTPTVLFDPAATPPALLAPGDTVRFEAVT